MIREQFIAGCLSGFGLDPSSQYFGWLDSMLDSYIQQAEREWVLIRKEPDRNQFWLKSFNIPVPAWVENKASVSVDHLKLIIPHTGLYKVGEEGQEFYFLKDLSLQDNLIENFPVYSIVGSSIFLKKLPSMPDIPILKIHAYAHIQNFENLPDKFLHYLYLIIRENFVPPKRPVGRPPKLVKT